MFSKNKPATEQVEVLYTGYLHKSPFLFSLSKGLKSWRRRFFVLSKLGEDTYHLTYYRNEEKKDKPVGEIDLSKVSLICTCPERHQMWDWIQKNFKCSPTCVLLLRVNDFMPKSARDYFLIGENSEEVDGWLNEILKVLKTQTSENKVQVIDDSLQWDNRLRSISAPIPTSQDGDEASSLTELPPFEQSEPLCIFTCQPLMSSLPRKFSDITLSDDEDDDDDIEKQTKTPQDNSEYMYMASVHMVLDQNQQEEDTSCQTNKSTSTNGLGSGQDLCNAADNQDKDMLEKRCSKTSLSDINRSCASTKLNNEPSNKSGIQTLVEKEICINRSDLNKSLIFTQSQGKPCVSECKQTETSHLFHKGDQILAFNDLLIDTVDEIQTFIKRLSKDEVKLTILRHPGSQPFHTETCSLH